MNDSNRAASKALTWGRIFRIFSLYVLVPVILVGLGLWFYSSVRARADLDREIAWVRARNEPLLMTELNDYYQADPTRPNMTAELEAALNLIKSLETKPEVKFLPFVGTTDDVPPPDKPWNDEQNARKIIAEFQPALDCFRAAAAKNATARYDIDFNAGMGVDLSTSQRIRDAARFLTLVSRVHSRDKNFDQAIEAIKCQVALANTLDRQPLAISQLIRFAVYGIALGEIDRLAQVDVLTDQQLAELQNVSKSFDLKNAFGLVVAGERPFGYSIAAARRWSVANPVHSSQVPHGIPPSSPYWVRDAQLYLETMRRMAEASENTNSNLKDEINKVTDDIRRIEKSGILSQVTYLTSAQMVPAMQMIAKAIVDRSDHQAVTQVGIGVIRYRERHGKLPAGLADLVPEFLDSVPIDPATGAPVAYQVDKKAATVSGQSHNFEIKVK